MKRLRQERDEDERTKTACSNCATTADVSQQRLAAVVPGISTAAYRFDGDYNGDPNPKHPGPCSAPTGPVPRRRLVPTPVSRSTAVVVGVDAQWNTRVEQQYY